MPLLTILKDIKTTYLIMCFIFTFYIYFYYLHIYTLKACGNKKQWI